MTQEIVARFSNNGAPLTSPATAPQITIYRTDTGAAVVTAQDMTEIAAGLFKYTVTGLDPLLDYAVSADGDPGAAGQTSTVERYAWGSIPGIGDDYERKIFTNRAETTVGGGGEKTIEFYDDDQTTVIDTIEISADGLSRTRP